MTQDKRCSRAVMDGFHSYQCTRKAVIERDGKAFCRQHDPVEVKRKQDERSARWEAEDAENRMRWERETAVKRAEEAVIDWLLQHPKEALPYDLRHLVDDLEAAATPQLLYHPLRPMVRKSMRAAGLGPATFGSGGRTDIVLLRTNRIAPESTLVPRRIH